MDLLGFNDYLTIMYKLKFMERYEHDSDVELNALIRAAFTLLTDFDDG